MDFERINTVLAVWLQTMNVPNLKTIHDAAMEELLEHQSRANPDAEPQPELPFVPTDLDKALAPKRRINNG